MILFLELFTFIILLNFEVLRKVTFMIFVFYFPVVFSFADVHFPPS